MDHTSLNLTRPPAEGGVTLSAVHLVTPFYFEDAHSTFGTVARIPGHEPRRGDVVRVARVLRILVRPLALVAFWTRPVVAHSALPGGAQKTTAIGVGAGADEAAALLLKPATRKKPREATRTPLEMLNIYEQTPRNLALL
jgi:hypothetical protein